MTAPGSGAPAVAFGRYAAWYDAFNERKSYDAEVEYLLRRIGTFTSSPARWLDVGCGTGHHLACLQVRGISVEGVDMSAEMIARATAAHPDIPFHVGRAQDIRITGNRDVVSMLFHVVNYQIDDQAVRSAFDSGAGLLAPGGHLVLDFWNSEAVALEPPARRVRQARIDGRSMFRLSIPSEDKALHRIDVRYEFRWDSPEGELAHEELHRLRHYSADELALFLRQAGMSVVTCDGWMTDAPLKPHDWYGFICARKVR